MPTAFAWTPFTNQQRTHMINFDGGGLARSRTVSLAGKMTKVKIMDLCRGADFTGKGLLMALLRLGIGCR